MALVKEIYQLLESSSCRTCICPNAKQISTGILVELTCYATHDGEKYTFCFFAKSLSGSQIYIPELQHEDEVDFELIDDDASNCIDPCDENWWSECDPDEIEVCYAESDAISRGANQAIEDLSSKKKFSIIRWLGLKRLFS